MPNPAKVILVILDGLGFHEAVEELGYPEALVAAGQARRWRMRVELPSVSYPLYETIQTGLPPISHGILSNAHLAPSRMPNIFSVAREGGKRTGAVAHDSFSLLYNGDPIDPVRDHECDDEARTIQYMRLYSVHGETRENPVMWPERDLMARVTAMTRRHAPDYILVHSSSCDAIGHRYGGGSPEYRQQAHVCDEALSCHIPEWRDRGYRVLITADHGMSAFGIHGGTRDEVMHVGFWDIGHPNPGVAEEVASQLSIAPTVLDILGLKPASGMTSPSLALS